MQSAHACFVSRIFLWSLCLLIRFLLLCLPLLIRVLGAKFANSSIALAALPPVARPSWPCRPWRYRNWELVRLTAAAAPIAASRDGAVVFYQIWCLLVFSTQAGGSAPWTHEQDPTATKLFRGAKEATHVHIGLLDMFYDSLGPAKIATKNA